MGVHHRVLKKFRIFWIFVKGEKNTALWPQIYNNFEGLTQCNRKERMKSIYNIKKNINLEVLCRGCPKEFLIYLKYCKNLRYYEKPDYYYLKQLFRNLFKRKGYILCERLFHFEIYSHPCCTKHPRTRSKCGSRGLPKSK